MEHKLQSFFAQFVSLVQECQKIKHELNTNPYRILEVNHNAHGEISLTVQVFGRNTTELEPREILNQEAFLEGFSKKDIKTIMSLAYGKEKKAKIILQELSTENHIIFGIRYNEQGEIIKRTANEVSQDADMLNNLSPIDAHRIGYVTADENAAQYQTQIKEMALAS